MEPLHIETTCTEEGVITLRDLPIRRGESFEIILISRPSPESVPGEFPLRGEPLSYLHPFEPVAVSDWEVAK